MSPRDLPYCSALLEPGGATWCDCYWRRKALVQSHYELKKGLQRWQLMHQWVSTIGCKISELHIPEMSPKINGAKGKLQRLSKILLPLFQQLKKFLWSIQDIFEENKQINKPWLSHGKMKWWKKKLCVLGSMIPRRFFNSPTLQQKNFPNFHLFIELASCFDNTKFQLGYFGVNPPSILPETNSLPLKMVVSNRNLLFQRSIFRGYVSFRAGNSWYHN